MLSELLDNKIILAILLSKAMSIGLCQYVDVLTSPLMYKYW